MAGGEESALFTSDGPNVVERFCRVYVQHATRLYVGIWVLLLALSGLVFAKGWLDIQETTINDWSISSSIEVQDQDALNAARDLQSAAVTVGGSVATRSVEAAFSEFMFIFEWSDASRTDSILTPGNLRTMCEVQRVLLTATSFPMFCVTDDVAAGLATNCSNTSSDIVARFYPTFAEQVACAPLDDLASFTAVAEDLLNSTAPGNAEDNGFFYQTSVISGAQSVLTKVRSQVALGGPLGLDTSDVDFSTLEDSEDGPQYDLYAAFVEDEVEPGMFELLGMADKPLSSAYNVHSVEVGDGLVVRYHAWYLRDVEFQRLVGSDQLLLVAAVLFVGVAMYIHIRSLFVAANGLFAVVISIPVAIVVYSGMCRIFYFNGACGFRLLSFGRSV